MRRLIALKSIKVILVGQPNVGKSMLINSISDSKLRVGNFTGVTIEKKEIKFSYGEYLINIVDLPGTYMLNDYTIEEKITSGFLKNESYDVILNVIDSTNLRRNLQLSSELLGLEKKMVMALNMDDEAKKENIQIDSKYMSELLGVDVIKVSALKKDGIDTLLKAIISTFNEDKKESKLIFSETIEEEISNITTSLKDYKYESELSYRQIAIALIKQDKNIYKELHDKPIWTALHDIVLNAINHIKIHSHEDNMEEIMANEFASFNEGIVAETLKTSKAIKTTITQKIDNILIHPILGIPIFLFFMWVLFQSTFTFGQMPMDYIDAFFVIIQDIVGENIKNDDFRSLIVDGLIAGVGAVILFIPNIAILFIGITLLEGTGYMSRVAYLLDGFFHRFGLHGQSFIPLVSGFGCSIPAYMSARTLKNDRDRLLTLFIIGFMSCSARLPVYVLFIGAFFAPEHAGNILFAIYLGGVLIGLILAKVLKLTAFQGDSEPFVMEMPKYRIPSLKLIWHTVQSKITMYLKKAGTFIALASMMIWFFSNYPKNINLSSEQQLEQSYLGQVGKFIEPLFTPIGMDWKMAVALQVGLAAKEMVVSTLGVLYSLEGDNDNKIRERIHQNISFASAVAFIVIIMTYLPCLAATIVFTKEAGGIKYFIYLFVFTSLVAYALAFVAYHIAL